MTRSDSDRDVFPNGRLAHKPNGVPEERNRAMAPSASTKVEAPTRRREPNIARNT